nr:hypothetical protein CFP56_22249 [Quercus suber]
MSEDVDDDETSGGWAVAALPAANLIGPAARSMMISIQFTLTPLCRFPLGLPEKRYPNTIEFILCPAAISFVLPKRQIPGRTTSFGAGILRSPNMD